MKLILDVTADKYRITQSLDEVLLYKKGELIDEEVSPAFLRTAYVLRHAKELLADIAKRYESGLGISDLIEDAKLLSDTLDEDRLVCQT